MSIREFVSGGVSGNTTGTDWEREEEERTGIDREREGGRVERKRTSETSPFSRFSLSLSLN